MIYRFDKDRLEALRKKLSRKIIEEAREDIVGPRPAGKGEDYWTWLKVARTFDFDVESRGLKREGDRWVFNTDLP